MPDEIAARLADRDDPAAVRAYLDHGGDPARLRTAALNAGAQAVLFELRQILRGRSGASTDTPRVEIRLQTHPVFLGRDHAYLAVISANHPAFENDPRFANVAPDGRRFCTLGAGPKNFVMIFGTLVSQVNRRTDTTALLPDTYDAEIQHPGVLSGEITEREAVERLFAADAGYGDDIGYDAVPFRWSRGYNSNSYVSGLLAAAGWHAKRPPSVPGWDKPLPPSMFARAGDLDGQAGARS